MNTLLLIFLAPFLTSTAVGQVESIQPQTTFLQTTALKFYCRVGSVFNGDISHCSPKEEVEIAAAPQVEQTVPEKVVEVVRNVFVPTASAQEVPSSSYLEAMIRRIVLELLPTQQVVQGPKGDKGDKGDAGVGGTQGLTGLDTPVAFWTGGGGSVSAGGSTVINNITNVFGSSSTSSLTADNGLTINPANNVQLGGMLLQDTNIDLDTRALTFDQTATSSKFKIQGASGYDTVGFSTQDIFQVETYANEGFALSSYETGPLVTDSHGMFLNFTSNLASPLGDPLGAYIYSDRTTGAIGMGRFAGGGVLLDQSSTQILSEGTIVTNAGSTHGFFSNTNNILVPGDAGYRFRVANATGNDIAVANFDGGVGLGVNMFVGQFDPNGQYTADPGSFYYNLSPLTDDDVLWVKGITGGYGTNTGWVPVTTGSSSPIATAWLLAGNGGTDPLNNFIGTTDGQDLVVRTNNSEVARFGLANNFSFGYGSQALSSNMNVMGNNAGTGANNAPNSNFFGIEAGAAATNASMANFFGFYAGNNATNAVASNFIGASAGNGATNATESSFIGDAAGFNATDASYSNFIGYRAGFVAANAANSNFIGNQAGSGATNAANSNFIGQTAGFGATDATDSNFVGFRSGHSATNATRSNFFGFFAGQGATVANNSNFFGESAGQDAVNASNSNFLGTTAGQNATNANNSNFFGLAAGLSAATAFGSNFFGQSAGSFATDAYNSNFFGANAGDGAASANNSNFFGPAAGQNATNANNSNFFGTSAGSQATDASNSNFLGVNSGINATNASNSNFFGSDAGNGATSASFSNFFGDVAGNGALNATYSNFFGQGAGSGATDASNANFFGANAGSASINGTYSNFFGNAAGNAATNAAYSNFFGNQAGSFATDAANSNFFGQNAGNGATNASNSTFIGQDSGSGATDASFSNFIGFQAGIGATNATVSNFFGPGAGLNATDASHSNFIGQNSGSSATFASNSNFFGNSAGNAATNASDSNFFGVQAGSGAIDAKWSNFIGDSAGSGATNAYNSNFFGQGTGENATNANNSNFLGTNSGNSATDAYNSNFFGASAGQGAVSANGSNFFGSGAGFNALNASNSNFFGTNAGESAANAASSNFFGQNAGQGAVDATNSNFFGTVAGLNATDATDSNFFGNNSGNGATFASRSNFFGQSSGVSAINASNSNFFGSSAGLLASGASNSNFFGQGTGENAINANNSNFLGTNSGNSATDAYNSNFFGASAGNFATNANNSNFFGQNAGLNATGAENSNFFGQAAGLNATGALLSNFIGQFAGLNATNASRSNFIGYSAGRLAPNAANSIFIGEDAGLSDTVNNGSYDSSILIGNKTNTGGFSNSIALGANVVNTAANQFILGSILATSSINEMYLGRNSTNAFPLIYSNLTGAGIGTTTVTERLNVGGNVRFSGALMPNNLSGAIGTVLLSQGAGLAPVWVATSSLGSSLQSVTNVGNITTNSIFVNKPTGAAELSAITGNDDAYLTLQGNAGATTLQMSSNNGGNWARIETASNGSFNLTADGNVVMWADGPTGFAGFGTTNPTERLQVGEALNTGNIIVYGTGTTCTIGNGVGATLCSSDERLKHDIVTAVDGSLLKIRNLRPVTYVWNENLNRGSTTHTGLIAQEVEQVFPEFVGEVYNGYKGIDYASLVTPLIGAVQELDVKISDLTGGTDMPLTILVNGVEEKTFIGNLFARMTEWFADASNGIGSLFANRVHTKELCVGEAGSETCISKGQLDALLNGQQIGPAQNNEIIEQPQGNSQGQGGTTTEPAASSTEIVVDQTPLDPGIEQPVESVVVDPVVSPSPVEEAPVVDPSPVDPVPAE